MSSVALIDKPVSNQIKPDDFFASLDAAAKVFVSLIKPMPDSAFQNAAANRSNSSQPGTGNEPNVSIEKLGDGWSIEAGDKKYTLRDGKLRDNDQREVTDKQEVADLLMALLTGQAKKAGQPEKAVDDSKPLLRDKLMIELMLMLTQLLDQISGDAEDGEPADSSGSASRGNAGAPAAPRAAQSGQGGGSQAGGSQAGGSSGNRLASGNTPLQSAARFDGGAAQRGPAAAGSGETGSASGNFSTANRNLLDSIARAEGTADRPGGGYNSTLGFGKYLPGGKEVKLTDMTLNEVYKLGEGMLANPDNKFNSSAAGRYQIINTTIKEAAKALGMDMNTTKFDEATQDRLALQIARQQGLTAWEGFKYHPNELANAKAAVADGGKADPGSAVAAAGVVGDGPVSMDGVPVKGAQATGGGAHAKGLEAFAQEANKSLPGGLGMVTALNDRFHQGRVSKHNQGLAIDIALKDPSKSGQAAEHIRNMFRGAGLNDNEFRVIDEYKNPSPHSTGGHMHVHFANKAAADKYLNSVVAAREQNEKTKVG
jgi:hypothetical protein